MERNCLEAIARHRETQSLPLGSKRENVALPRRRSRTHGRSKTHSPSPRKRSHQKYRQRRTHPPDRCRASPRTLVLDRSPMSDRQSPLDVAQNIAIGSNTRYTSLNNFHFYASRVLPSLSLGNTTPRQKDSKRRRLNKKLKSCQSQNKHLSPLEERSQWDYPGIAYTQSS